MIWAYTAAALCRVAADALALGLANLMIERGYYDDKFVRAWTNGPLLVRSDNGRLLIRDDGAGHFAWDTVACCPISYDSKTGRYQGMW